MTRTEILRRLRALIAASKQTAGLPGNARLSVALETCTIDAAPADGYDVSAARDELSPTIDTAGADYWVKHHGAAGAVVTLYFETLSDGEFTSAATAMGWIGTDDAAPVLMEVNGELALRTLDTAPTARRTRPAAPVQVADATVAMTRSEIIDEFNKLLDQFGLRDRGWTASINTRMTRTYGICRYGPRRVEVSWPIARLNGRAETMNTIAHEVAHAIAGPGAGHGPKWKDACALTGARPERCYSGDEVATPKGRYVATCAACGADCGSRNRAPKPVTYYHRPSACKGYVRGTKNNAIVWTDTRSAR